VGLTSGMVLNSADTITRFIENFEDPDTSNLKIGTALYRINAIPEPSGLALIGLGLLGLGSIRRKQKKN